MSLTKVRDFKYGEDNLIVADMDKRHKSYIFLMVEKINELIDAVNTEVLYRKNRDKEFDKRVLKAEREAADKIKNKETDVADTKQQSDVKKKE